MDICLSVGSNRSYEDVEKALVWLQSKIFNFKTSRLYKTPSIHHNESSYVNAVVKGSIDTSLEDFNNLLKEYELKSGRDDTARKSGLVPIDIDIVIGNGKILRVRDYKQEFFKIGFLELTGSEIEDKSDK